MPGNWPARFLGEGAAATSSPYPTLIRLSDGLCFSGIHGHAHAELVPDKR